MPATPPTRAQRRAASEAAILEAAIRSYGDRGPDGASLRDVAGAAGVTHPLVARYFGSKQGLIADVGDQLTAWAAAEIDAADSCTATGLTRLLHVARTDRSMTKLLIRSALGDLRPDGFPACLSPRRRAPELGAAPAHDRRIRLSRYASSSLLLGWLTFDGFMTSALGLDAMGEPDHGIAAAAAHLCSLAATEEPTLEPAPLAPAGPVAPTPTRAEDRSSRERLLAAAIELFAQRGPAAVTIRDVARHAGLNQGLLHRHFGSKHDLTVEAIDEGVASLMPGALAPGGFDVDRVVQVMHTDPIPARLIARTLVDEIGIGSVRLRFPVMEGVLSIARSAPPTSRPPGLEDPRLAAVAAASMVGGSVIWGSSLRTADEWADDLADHVPAVMAGLSRHLLGLGGRR